MTGKEKWRRMKHPTCAEDYGLSLNEKEMMSFKEGRDILRDIKSVNRAVEGFGSVMRRGGISAAEVRDELITGVLERYAPGRRIEGK